jgi:Mrp family chromosome partitioning ATPase
VLVDCDVARPALHLLFGIEPVAGTLALLAGQQSAVARPQHTGLPGLSVVPCELTGVSSGSWLDAAGVTRLFGLGGTEGLTLLSAPPILTDPQTLALAAQADATLLVVPSIGCRRAELAEATRLLGLAGASVLGVVTTRDGR